MKKQYNSCGCESNVCCPHQDSTEGLCNRCRKIPEKCTCKKNKIRCKNCNGTNLRPDHGGYYCHAKDGEGRPYLCLDCDNNSRTPWKWQCLICGKEISIYADGRAGNDEEGILPNLEGGTLEIHFGFGSKFDQIEDMIRHRNCRIQGAICDWCFQEKQSLTRKVDIIEKRKYVSKPN